MSLSTDCRVASLIAFSQARAMGTGTNAGGGALTGAADCGRDADGKFDGGNKCAGEGGGATSADQATGGGSMPKSKTEDPRNANSWLSPSGEFHPVARESSDGGWNTHHRWAVTHGVAGGEEELLAKGWMRVVRVGQSLYAANEEGKSLTDKQAKSLSEHAAWAGYDDVVHEHAKGRSKTVWSKDDRSLALEARIASLLAFAESRDCGRDPDGKFSSGNTCASGALAEAAQGAAVGAVKGAITGLIAGGPATVKPGAAIGAGVGAVKGIYDNQMRPTRVKRTIEGLGMTTDQVGSLVEKLGGTPDSSADTKGSVLRLTIRDKDGKKSFHVEIDKKTITVYPRRPSGELSGREIVRLKKIADESTPKSISVVVKKSSSAYVAKLVKNGFTMAAGHAADVLVANYSTPLVHSVASDVYQSLKKKFS